MKKTTRKSSQKTRPSKAQVRAFIDAYLKTLEISKLRLAIDDAEKSLGCKSSRLGKALFADLRSRAEKIHNWIIDEIISHDDA